MGYNKEQDTIQEYSFTVPTPVGTCELKNTIDCLEDMFRFTYILGRIQGFFPPHRDMEDLKFRTFELIVPLQEVNPPNVNFLVVGKIINWVTKN